MTAVSPDAFPDRLVTLNGWRAQCEQAQAGHRCQRFFAAITAFFAGLLFLAGVRGNLMHRTPGYGWVVAMAARAISAFMLLGPVGR